MVKEEASKLVKVMRNPWWDALPAVGGVLGLSYESLEICAVTTFLWVAVIAVRHLTKIDGV